ncbi:hypothetical protein [Kitasatospora sp. NPDC091207]|uniref:hypothetical protein n=1 Tax=Kitasatospora sp. NPDC091207 TaxID=3364083 RepID=UPI0037F551D3
MKRHRALAVRSTALPLILLLSACGSVAAPVTGDGAPASPLSRSDPGEAALQKLESALGDQGRADFADTFGTLQLDVAGGRVILFATGEERARALIEAAAKAHPDIDTSRAEIRRCQYSRRTVDPALRRIADAMKSDRLPAPVHTVGLLPDGSGIKVTTTKEGTASKELKDAVAKLAGGILVAYEVGKPLRGLDATATMGPPDAGSTPR